MLEGPSADGVGRDVKARRRFCLCLGALLMLLASCWKRQVSWSGLLFNLSMKLVFIQQLGKPPKEDELI